MQIDIELSKSAKCKLWFRLSETFVFVHENQITRSCEEISPRRKVEYFYVWWSPALYQGNYTKEVRISAKRSLRRPLHFLKTCLLKAGFWMQGQPHYWPLFQFPWYLGIIFFFIFYLYPLKSINTKVSNWLLVKLT